MRSLAEGEYRIDIRANHVGVVAASPLSATIPVKVELAEISGSETYIHGRHGALTLIARLGGVHDYDLGEHITLYFDPARLLVFDTAGRLVAAPESRLFGRRAA